MRKMLEAVTLSELQDHLQLVRSTDEGQQEGRSSKVVSHGCRYGSVVTDEKINLIMFTVPLILCHDSACIFQ